LLKQNFACSEIDRMRLWRVPSAIVVAVVTLWNQLPSLAGWPSRRKALCCFETSGNIQRRSVRWQERGILNYWAVKISKLSSPI